MPTPHGPYWREGDVIELRHYPVIMVVDDSPHQRSELALGGIKARFPEIQQFNVEKQDDIERAVARLQKGARRRAGKPMLIVVHSAWLAHLLLLRLKVGSIDILLTDLHMLHEAIPGDGHYRLRATDTSLGKYVPAGFVLAMRAARGRIPVAICSTGHHHQDRLVGLLGPIIGTPFGGSGEIVYFEAEYFSINGVRGGDVRYVNRFDKICRVVDRADSRRARFKRHGIWLRNQVFRLCGLITPELPAAVGMKKQTRKEKLIARIFRIGWWIRARLPLKSFWAGDLKLVDVFEFDSGRKLGTVLHRDTEPVKNWGKVLDYRLQMSVEPVTG